jgi:hypothetical protein
VTLFANTFKSPYYEHLIGSSSQHCYNVIRIAKRIEHEIKLGCIVESIEKKGFTGKKTKGYVYSLREGYKAKEVNYKNAQMHTSQFTNVNFINLFTPNQTNQANN